MTEKLDQTITHLIENERFFGEMLMRMKRRIRYDIPTMGVSYDKNGVVLHINPYFIENMKLKEAASIIKHECCHVANDHFERELYIEPEFNRLKVIENPSIQQQINDMVAARELNVAEDIAINQYITDLPKTFLMYDENGLVIIDEREKVNAPKGNEIPNPNYMLPQQFEPCTVENMRKQFKESGIKTKILDDQPFEYYYQLKKDNQDKLPQNQVIVQVVLDNHGMKDEDGEGSVTDPELQKEIASKLLNDSNRAAEEHQAGSTPGYMQLLIDKLNKKPKDWKKDLSRFMARNTSAYKEIARNRRNRRQRPDVPLNPGYRALTKLHVVAGFDVSGSMCDEQLEQIVAELAKIHDMGVNISVVQFDTEVKSSETFKNSKVKIMGRGGTCFNPFFNHLASKEFTNQFESIDAILVFTDGGCWESASELIKPKAPVLWALNEGCTVNADYGYRTEVRINRK